MERERWQQNTREWLQVKYWRKLIHHTKETYMYITRFVGGMWSLWWSVCALYLNIHLFLSVTNVVASDTCKDTRVCGSKRSRSVILIAWSLHSMVTWSHHNCTNSIVDKHLFSVFLCSWKQLVLPSIMWSRILPIQQHLCRVPPWILVCTTIYHNLYILAVDLHSLAELYHIIDSYLVNWNIARIPYGITEIFIYGITEFITLHNLSIILLHLFRAS